jgi:hypothetical protein
VLLLLRGNPSWLHWQMLVGAALVVAGGLSKQNVIALPLALGTWAAIHDCQRLLQILLAGLAVSIPTLALIYAIWGADLPNNTLLLPRLTSWGKSAAMTWQIVPVISLFLGLSIAGGILLRPLSKATLVCALLVWSAAAGFWMLSGAGVNYNVVFDFIVALAVGCAAAVLAAERTTFKLPSTTRIRRRVIMTLVAFTQIACVLHYYRNPDARDINALFHAEEWSILTNEISEAKGPVACEILAVCYWAHKPFEVDFFNFGQKLLTGVTTDDDFRQKLAHRYYTYILISKGSIDSPLLPVDTMQQLLATYRPVRLVDGNALLLEPAH